MNRTADRRSLLARGARRLVGSAATVAVLIGIGATPAAADGLGGLGSFGSFGSMSSDVSVGASGAFGMVSVQGVGALLDSSFALADLDPVTGAILGNDVSTAMSADYAVAADLSSSSLMALDSAELARATQEKADAARKAQAATGQSGVGSDGCPTTAPENTLRNGSINVGIAQLCADSVAEAPTAEAARAIKFQLNNLGVPYSQPNRMKDGYFDCSSFAMRSYTDGGLNLLVNGWAPNTSSIRTSRWAVRISQAESKAGDLIFPTPGHVATKLADGYVVHTNRPGDVSHVRSMYTDTFYVVRVDPSAV